MSHVDVGKYRLRNSVQAILTYSLKQYHWDRLQQRSVNTADSAGSKIMLFFYQLAKIRNSTLTLKWLKKKDFPGVQLKVFPMKSLFRHVQICWSYVFKSCVMGDVRHLRLFLIAMHMAKSKAGPLHMPCSSLLLRIYACAFLFAMSFKIINKLKYLLEQDQCNTFNKIIEISLNIT